MIRKNTILYNFEATYTRTLHGVSHSFEINRLFQVEILKEQVKTSFYDPNLSINVACHEILQRDYEIEIENITTKFEKTYRRLEDFYRRVNYRYDWIVLRTLENGKIDSVENKDELRKNWKELSGIIRADYVGNAVNEFLGSIDSDFSRDKHFLSLFNQYFYFGLLFPPIPYRHKQDWEIERNVMVWETRNVGLKEKLAFVSKEGDIRSYKISGELLSYFEYILDKYEGEIKYSSAQKMVKEADLHLIYTNSGTNEWIFKLRQIGNKK